MRYPLSRSIRRSLQWTAPGLPEAPTPEKVEPPANPARFTDYRRQVTKLEVALADPEGSAQALAALRALMKRIVLTQDLDGRGAAIEVQGMLTGILS